VNFGVLLTPDARRDRDDIVAWYDENAPGQASRFVDEFYGAARRLEGFPHSGPVVRGGARRVTLRTFPYQLWYLVHDDEDIVEIIAVLHDRQDPTHLSKRL
jgi:plasmid stabilization system protein ParE